MITPCFWFDDSAEAAAALYTGLFPGGKVTAVSRYPRGVDNPGGRPRGSVLSVDFTIAGQPFSALNGGPDFKPNFSISFFLQVPTAAEATRVYTALAEGGSPLMPLDRYPWSECYGWIQDRFGVSWQVMAGPLEPGSPTVVPCFMFSGPQHRRAETAMQTWVAAFPNSKVLRIERYAEGEGPVDTVKHGRFVLDGQEFVAMDSHMEHHVTFTEGVSMQVRCPDQAEVDRVWRVLAEGGKHSQCGWLADRFGVSWQTVPAQMPGWITSPDAAASERVFAAMMPMQRLDVAALQRAFDGR